MVRVEHRTHGVMEGLKGFGQQFPVKIKNDKCPWSDQEELQWCGGGLGNDWEMKWQKLERNSLRSLEEEMKVCVCMELCIAFKC